MLRFVKQWRKDETDTAKRKIWTSRCGGYRIVESVSLFKLPTAVYAMFLSKINGLWSWEIVSKHRSKRQAFLACRKFANQTNRGRATTAGPRRGRR